MFRTVGCQLHLNPVLSAAGVKMWHSSVKFRNAPLSHSDVRVLTEVRQKPNILTACDHLKVSAFYISMKHV